MKSIKKASDLAINGAPPAFAEPIHVGRPNIGNRDTFMRLLGQVIDNHWLSNNGPMVQEFERRIASYLGVKHCVAMCNGTIALEIGIRALDLEGEVIIPSWTFVATAHALHWQGITPVFADVDPRTHNLDPDAVRSMITPRTTGIIGVHLWGRPAPIDDLQAIADEHGLKLMYDAAHAFGSAYRGQSIGCFGSCEVLSFHATKAFNTMEGGAVVTNDDELAEAMRLMRNFGFVDYDKVIHPGTNGKMIEACAAMGLANLGTFENVVRSNRNHHAAYAAALADVPGVSVLAYNPADRNSYHYVVLEVDEHFNTSRDHLVAALHAEKILARKYFWPGCHGMQPYRDLFPHAKLMLPNTQRIANGVVVLPNGATLQDGCIETVASVCRVLGDT
jgi:dTDP-4-amino-4,6-dideoxygalactose transaminase